MGEEAFRAWDRWVRVMADYKADGVWDQDGVARCADELPVPPSLQERLLRWQAWYEDYDPHETPPVELDWEAFTAEGLAIAREIKKALPDWTVVYFDEAALRRARAGQGSQDDVEYEITVDTGPAG